MVAQSTGVRRGPGAGSPVRRSPEARLARLEHEYLTRGATALAPVRAPARAPHPGRSLRSATPERRRHLRLAPPIPVRGPHAPFVILVLGVVIIGVLGILVLNTKINENAFRLSDLQAQQGSLDQREQQLGAAVAASDAPNSLAVAARKLGLAPARTSAHVKQPTGQGTAAQRPSAAASATAGGH